MIGRWPSGTPRIILGNFDHYDGEASAQAIINHLGPGDYAAYYASQVGTGWYLPSVGELDLIYNNLSTNSVVNLTSSSHAKSYGSSSEKVFNTHKAPFILVCSGS